MKQDAPFAGGPPQRLQTWLGLLGTDERRTPRRAVLTIVVGWLPLALLAAMHGDFLHAGTAYGFATDCGVHTRLLLASPLFILSEALCIPKLAEIARQFASSGLVGLPVHDRYESAVTSTQRLMNSRAAEIIAIGLAYGLIASVAFATPADAPRTWYAAAGALTPAGWWSLVISLPMLLLLLIGWLWRICLWVRFLWLMSRLDLNLIPSHPDHAGGLRFVGYSLDAFVPLALVIGILCAGPVLNQVVHRGASPLQFEFFIAGVTAFVVVLFSAPPLLFGRRLIGERRRGVFEYGTLALNLGVQLEHKWLHGRPTETEALAVPDFSATTDLYSIVSNVYAMLIVPLELRSFGLLIGAVLLPFVPVALLAAPFDVIIGKIAGLLL